MYLSEMTWLQARRALTANTLVLIPLGAAAKEHGPHLRLDNDRVLAEYLAARIANRTGVVVAPTLTYHFYPAFTAYAGSTTLRLETARDMTVEVVSSLAAFGPRRFYVLNTGVSTVQALEPAAAQLASQGILMDFTRIERIGNDMAMRVQQQTGGTHADEIETSMMLYIDQKRVDMSKAARDFNPGRGALNPNANGPGIYSPTGIYGDATLANEDKGRLIVEAMVAELLGAIEALENSPLPSTGPG
ncbi:MAG: creatininase family protein [Burkholderiales bacterium]|jgi:creatinine amidohydrolase